MKIKCSIRVEEEVYKAAQERARRQDSSVAEVLAEAAGRDLLARKQRDDELLGGIQQLLVSQRKGHQSQAFELAVLKEMVGLLARAFFNHVPAVPEEQRAAAILSGKERFHRYLEALAVNLKDRGPNISQITSSDQLSVQRPAPMEPSSPARNHPHTQAPPSSKPLGLFE